VGSIQGPTTLLSISFFILLLLGVPKVIPPLLLFIDCGNVDDGSDFVDA
jgi:hypothetical protein